MIRFENLCPGCFRTKNDDPVCPRCGYDEGRRRPPLALDHRTLLDGRYLIGRVLGKPGGLRLRLRGRKNRRGRAFRRDGLSSYMELPTYRKRHFSKIVSINMRRCRLYASNNLYTS